MQFPAVLASVTAVALALFSYPAAAAGQGGHVVTDLTSGKTFDTRTGMVSVKGLSMPGLVSVSIAADRQMLRFWEPGAGQQTVTVDGETLVDGRATSDVARFQSMRLSRDGSLVYLRSAKGPKSKVELIQDGEATHAWPRGSYVSLISFDEQQLVFSLQDPGSGALKFSTMLRDVSGRIDAASLRPAGRLEACSMLGAKALGEEIVLEVLCGGMRGADIARIDASGEIRFQLQGGAHEMLVSGLDRKQDGKAAADEVSVLSVEGSEAARQLFHAVSASLLSDLGEPGSIASDDAGYLSWAQSYRVLALSELFARTGHPVFGEIANSAIADQFQRVNARRGLAGEHNPACGWASRIYSESGSTPISFMINQAMVLGGMIESCERLGAACEAENSQRIGEAAICLAQAHEPLFEEATQLYRVPYGVDFRYDGVWAPWNWQMRFTRVLEKAAQVSGNTAWSDRAGSLKARFLASWDEAGDGALWRYWPAQYYAGWSEDARVSVSIPARKREEKPRSEDVNHAGISLMAFGPRELPEELRNSLSSRVDALMAQGEVLGTFLDGSGARSPRWYPAAGFEAAENPRLSSRYSRLMPGASTGPRHLAYARAYDPDAAFDLRLTLLRCGSKTCRELRDWRFASAQEFLAGSPLFSIRELQLRDSHNAKQVAPAQQDANRAADGGSGKQLN
jgi:hypothetical protein